MAKVEPVIAESVEPIFCSVNQAAQALGLAPYTVRELCRAKALVSAKHGRMWLVDLADLQRYARDLKSQAWSA